MAPLTARRIACPWISCASCAPSRSAARRRSADIVEQCGHCDHTRISYNSCRNRHCPKCQNSERAKWLESRQAELLPVPYFHVVFTVPQQIGTIAFHNPETVYNILFSAASQTLLTIAGDPKHLGAGIGFFAVLHTWGQNLLQNPTCTAWFPVAGCLRIMNAGSPAGPVSFFPCRVLSRLFRRLFLEALEKAFENGRLQWFGELEPLRDPEAFARYLDPLRQSEWVVYAKPHFGGPQQVLAYLGRYTHRVAISNQRFLSLHQGQVSFQWKDCRHKGKHNSTTMTLAADEFIRRFLIHTLPPGFQRIRHFGFLANCHRKEKLTLCRSLLTAPLSDLLPPPASLQFLDAIPEKPIGRCPECGIGMLIRIQILPPFRWPVTPWNSS